MLEQSSAASVALIRGNSVLLIQRAKPPNQGHWTLPGGRLEPGETARAAAEREVKEELGLEVSALRPVTQLTVAGLFGQIVQSQPAREFRLQVFATDTFGGEITPSEEIADYRWIGSDQIAGLPLTPHLPQVIAAALAVFDRT